MKRAILFTVFAFVMLLFAIQANDLPNQLFWLIVFAFDAAHLWHLIKKELADEPADSGFGDSKG